MNCQVEIESLSGERMKHWTCSPFAVDVSNPNLWPFSAQSLEWGTITLIKNGCTMIIQVFCSAPPTLQGMRNSWRLHALRDNSLKRSLLINVMHSHATVYRNVNNCSKFQPGNNSSTANQHEKTVLINSANNRSNEFNGNFCVNELRKRSAFVFTWTKFCSSRKAWK